jgi:hypothetical protein
MPGGWLRGWSRAGPAVLAGLCLAVLPGALAAARGLSPGNPDTVPVPRPYQVHARSGPVAEARTELKAFATAPFPYDGKVPRTNARFLDTVMDGRRGHRSSRGRVFWEESTYSDARVLLHIPEKFDARRPAVMIVFFHGHGATLERDVRDRQRVPEQISHSGANAVLVAPQFAVDAPDSSAGKFWQPGACRRFLDEAAVELARMHGEPRTARTFEEMPVVVVAYSGGYLPAAWCLSAGGLGSRLRGVVLLDALYGELETFASWIANSRSGFLVSAYTRSTGGNHTQLARMLAARNVTIESDLAQALRRGGTSLLSAAPTVRHRDFVTYAWAERPISDLLARLREYPR